MSRKVDEESLEKSNLRFPVEVRMQRLCLTLSYGPACSSGLKLPHDAVAYVGCAMWRLGFGSDTANNPRKANMLGEHQDFSLPCTRTFL